MANNIFQAKRTNVSGRTPNTTGSYVTNSQYIAAGEFALNMADGILYTSNGSAVITVGSNLVNQNITGNLTVKAIIANGSIGTAGQVLTTNSTGVYWSTVTAGGSGTVTQVNTGNGMTGGPITTTGTVSILANSGITANSTGTFVTQGTGTVVNATGVHVNATYIGTISANNASFLNSKTEGNLNVNNALTANNSTNLGGQAAAYYTNATNITTGTLPYAQIPANIINTTAAFTISGVHTHNANIVIGTAAGISANGGFGTAGQVLHSNGTSVYWAADDNSGGTVTSVATGNGMTGGPITTTGTVSILANTGIVANSTGTFVNATYIGTISANNASFLGGTAAASYVQNTDSRTLSGNLVISGTSFTPSTNTILLGNSTQRWVLSANTGSFSGSVSGITTLAAGNTTITGFINISSTSVLTGNVAIGTTNTTAYALNVNGSFAATTKSFVINHPTKEGQKLRYASLEGPENGVYVRGKLEGKSIIELPEYWWNLIDESTTTVNLTPIGRSQDIWVQSTSAYFIHLNQPADCFFTVFAERKDVDKLVVEY